MKSATARPSPQPLVTRIHKLFRPDMARENDFLKAENRILRKLLGTRRVHVAGCTPNPDAAWMRQQARNFSMILDEHTPADKTGRSHYLIHDRDTTFLPFDQVLKTQKLESVKTPARRPWCSGYAERFVREARETLDHLILIGPRQLHAALKAIEKHHNANRPHQGLDNAIPLGYQYPDQPAPPADVQCDESLGGLLNHYHVRPAA